MKKRIFIAIVLSFVFSLSAFCAPNYSYNVYTPTPYVQKNVAKSGNFEVIELVADYSGSMGKWIKLAKNTMESILPQIPQNTKVGFRAFGQLTQKSYSNFGQAIIGSVFATAEDCRTSTLIAPPKTNNNSNILTGMHSLATGGATPLTYALEQTAYQDFALYGTSSKKKIILITDGGETCGGDPCLFVRKLVNLRQDIQIDVIMVNNSDRLKCLSTATGGSYHKVRNDNDFNNALNTTFGTKPQNMTSSTPSYKNSSPSETHYEFLP